MLYKERIVSNPNIMLGKPVIKGTRITVELILKKLAEGANRKDLLAIYPHLSTEDINAVLDYASEVIGNEDVIDLSE
jgi:uncharacterized protein (DUF433 family)